MAERYTRIFVSHERKYQKNSPAIIEAMSLLKDNKQESVIAQVKFSSLKPGLSSLRISIDGYNAWNKKVFENLEYQYTDIHVQRDQEFGSKTPVEIPDSSVKTIQVRIIDAVFEDRTVWNDDSEPIMLPAQQPLNETLSSEGVTNYRKLFGDKMVLAPLVCEDLWFCACGGLNRTEEEQCHVCGKKLTELLSGLDEAFLSNETSYREACRLSENKESPELLNKASALFASLGDYKDSADLSKIYAELAKTISNDRLYDQAISHASEATSLGYEKAVADLENLGEWKDSLQKLEEFREQAKIVKLREVNAQKKKKKKILTIASVAGALILGVIGFFATQQDYVTYFGCGYKQDKLEKFKCYDSVSVLDSETRKKDALEEYVLEAYKQNDYEETLRRVTAGIDASTFNQYPVIKDAFVDSEVRLSEEKYRNDPTMLSMAYNRLVGVDQAAAEKVQNWMLEAQYQDYITRIENGEFDPTMNNLIADDLYDLYKKRPALFKDESEFNKYYLWAMHNQFVKGQTEFFTYYADYVLGYEKTLEAYNSSIKTMGDFYNELKTSGVPSSVLNDPIYYGIRLLGRWSNGDDYFELDDAQQTSYNIPWFEYGDYYSIEDDGVIYLLKEGELPKNGKKLFRIISLSDTSVTFLCYKDDSTHTLYKN